MKALNYSFFVVALVGTLLGACGGGGSSSDTDNRATVAENENIVIKEGVFLDSAVGGVEFVSGGQEGVTDENGTFLFEEGKTVRFSVGGVLIGESVAAEVITPVNLVEGEDLSNPAVVNIARFLQTLDEDGDPTNGISVSTSIANEIKIAGSSIDFNVPTDQFEEQNSVIIQSVLAVPLKNGNS